jgi:CRP-like cAMP-binding protein
VKTSHLAAFPLLADVPAAELDALAAVMRVVRAHTGRQVVARGDYGTAVYFIEEGEADVLTDNGESAKRLRRGDMFGEIALLLTGQRTATIVARTPMRLLTLSGHEFDRIRAQVPELERSLRRLGVERVGELPERRVPRCR